jgi:hypothetical protein
MKKLETIVFDFLWGEVEQSESDSKRATDALTAYAAHRGWSPDGEWIHGWGTDVSGLAKDVAEFCGKGDNYGT